MKLTRLVTDILGVSSLAILTAIIAAMSRVRSGDRLRGLVDARASVWGMAVAAVSRDRMRGAFGTTFLLAVLAAGCAQVAGSGAQPADAREAATAAYFDSIRDEPAMLAAFLERMPVGGDIHHHLGGGVRTPELIRMAMDDRLCLPRDHAAQWVLQSPPCGEDERPIAEALEDIAFRREIERRWSMLDYLGDSTSMDRIAASEHFFASFGKLALVQRDISRLLAAARTLAAGSGVIYLETATSHTPDPEARDALAGSVCWNDDLAALRRTVLADPRFAALRDATIESLAQGLEASDRMLGCDTGVPDPGCGVFVRFQHLTVRTFEPVVVFVNLLLAYEIAAASPLVVGINLAAAETHPVALRDYDLHMRMLGELAAYYPAVRRSLHAGEMLDAQAAALGAERHIRLAVAPAEAGGAAAHRLGHAVALKADPQPEALLVQMRRRGVAIEISPESNRQLLGVDPVNHPLVDYLTAGVPVVLATDDPGLMLSDLRRQFALAARNVAVSYPTLKALATNSIAYSFLPQVDRQRLLRRLEGDFAVFEATRWETPHGGGAR